ncbi:unnamed protein product, partial [Laminaria digitata]
YVGCSVSLVVRSVSGCFRFFVGLIFRLTIRVVIPLVVRLCCCSVICPINRPIGGWTGSVIILGRRARNRIVFLVPSGWTFLSFLFTALAFSLLAETHVAEFSRSAVLACNALSCSSDVRSYFHTGSQTAPSVAVCWIWGTSLVEVVGWWVLYSSAFCLPRLGARWLLLACNRRKWPPHARLLRLA